MESFEWNMELENIENNNIPIDNPNEPVEIANQDNLITNEDSNPTFYEKIQVIFTNIIKSILFITPFILSFKVKNEFNHVDMYIQFTSVFWFIQFLANDLNEHIFGTQNELILKASIMVQAFSCPILLQFGIQYLKQFQNSSSYQRQQMIAQIAVEIVIEAAITVILIYILIFLFFHQIIKPSQNMQTGQMMRNKIIKYINKRTMKQLQSMQVLEDENACGICLEDYCEQDSVSKLECTHHFHRFCLQKWFNKNLDEMSCPYCRKSHFDNVNRIDQSMDRLLEPNDFFGNDNAIYVQDFDHNLNYSGTELDLDNGFIEDDDINDTRQINEILDV